MLHEEYVKTYKTIWALNELELRWAFARSLGLISELELNQIWEYYQAWSFGYMPWIDASFFEGRYSC